MSIINITSFSDCGAKIEIRTPKLSSDVRRHKILRVSLANEGNGNNREPDAVAFARPYERARLAKRS